MYTTDCCRLLLIVTSMRIVYGTVQLILELVIVATDGFRLGPPERTPQGQVNENSG